MFKCELFSVQKNKADTAAYNNATDEISAALSVDGIELQHTTECAADAKKLSKAILEKLNASDSDLFLFVNALSTTDNSSFRKLFYRTIEDIEATIPRDKEHRDLTPKLKVSSIGDLGNGYKGYCFSYSGKRFIALPCASLTGGEIKELIRNGVAASNDVFTKNAELYPVGVAFFDQQGREVDPQLNQIDISAATAPTAPKKQGFFRSFIPQKEDTKKQKIRKIVVLIAIVAFIGALIYVLEFYIFGPMRNDAVNSEIQTIAHNKDKDGGDSDGPEQDWDALKAINEEIVGWITIPDTKIDYPVLYHEGDDRYHQYYLKRTYKEESSEYGSIFIDYRSPEGAKSRNVIMHGHDMLDGSMFAGLLGYSPKGDLKGDLEFYQDHPVITFNTPDGDAKYKIISVFKTSTRYEHGEFFNYMQGEFNSDAEFMNFVYNMRVRSFFDIPVTCNEGDQIITLSTCCYEFYQWRLVVVARKVRPGEDKNVDVSLASRNSAPLFPDVYYSRYGGTRPETETFKSANAKGLIDWYDGKGNLQGSEDLTATLESNPTEPPTEPPKKNEPKPTDPPPTTYFPVTYHNFDGSQYAAYNVKEGDPVPTPSGTPVIPEDDYYTYVFKGWDKSVEGVDFDHLNVGIDIYPKFDAIKKE
ncbi:class B sortase [uncultured Ruminococcus sp.]|uniref:class B sortase n=1 Tax=uncultured Ruminococcus sp. TaxID=165186 RepID=UPI002930D6EF|nr:class B sortase [uncultured Ruminococcus sp.]